MNRTELGLHRTETSLSVQKIGGHYHFILPKQKEKLFQDTHYFQTQVPLRLSPSFSLTQTHMQ